ncbi:MAG TPA: inositol monophosphatase family protein [Kofleriaceae bacterium]|nr:inositol monophosphatase family protein [Kofleriaceae bacterium]
MRDLLEVAKRAASTASDLLRNAHAEDIRSKSNQFDLVTEWDLRSEEAIRRVLADTHIPVLGEEMGTLSPSSTPAGDLRWVVDPIDGTVNFSHGLPIWSISIALERVLPDGSPTRGESLLGVVAAPALGWSVSAIRGEGAFDDRGTPLRVSSRAQLSKSMLATGFPYDAATNPANNFAEWDHFQRLTNACRRLGCASIDLCLVARGFYDGYWERRLSPWDLAAGALFVVEAGGTVTNTQGGPFDAHSGEAAATNGAIHGELLSELARVRS